MVPVIHKTYMITDYKIIRNRVGRLVKTVYLSTIFKIIFRKNFIFIFVKKNL